MHYLQSLQNNGAVTMLQLAAYNINEVHSEVTNSRICLRGS